LLHRDRQALDLLLRQEQQVAGGGIGRGRHEDVDHRRAGQVLHLAHRGAGDEADRPGAVARVFDQRDLAEGRALPRQHGLEELFGGAVDRTQHRYPGHQPGTLAADGAADHAGGQHADQQQEETEQQQAEPRHREGQIGFRVPLRRNQRHDAGIDEGEEPEGEPDGDADRRRHQDAGQQVVAQPAEQARARCRLRRQAAADRLVGAVLGAFLEVGQRVIPVRGGAD